jgi:hypothetical protein
MAMRYYAPSGCGRDGYMNNKVRAAQAPRTGYIPRLTGPDPPLCSKPIHGRSDPMPNFQPSGSGRDMYFDRRPPNTRTGNTCSYCCPSVWNLHLIAGEYPFRDGMK